MPETGTPCCSDRTASDLSVTDLLARPVDIARVAEGATIEGTTRGQDTAKCPTDPLPLHANFTDAVVNVSGDLKIDKESCKVKISFKEGKGGAKIFEPGIDVGITVPVAADFVMNGHCVETKDRKRCKWSFTRTSP